MSIHKQTGRTVKRAAHKLGKHLNLDQIKENLRKGIGMFGKLARGGKRPGKS